MRRRASVSTKGGPLADGGDATLDLAPLTRLKPHQNTPNIDLWTYYVRANFHMWDCVQQARLSVADK